MQIILYFGVEGSQSTDIEWPVLFPLRVCVCVCSGEMPVPDCLRARGELGGPVAAEPRSVPGRVDDEGDLHCAVCLPLFLSAYVVSATSVWHATTAIARTLSPQPTNCS